jgi:proliferating cell nuclear antigen
MKGKIKAGIVKDLMAGISQLIDEGKIIADKEGLHFIMADRAMVCVVAFDIPSKTFESFEATNEEMGLNITNFNDVIRRASSNDFIILEGDKARLKLEIIDDVKRKFDVPLLDLGKEEIPPIEEIEYKTTVEIPTEVLKNAIDDADIISDSVVIESSPLGKFLVKSKGDLMSAEMELATKIIGEGKSRYPLDYLKKIMRGSISEKVKLSYGVDNPLKVEFETDKAKIFYILAPRVVEDQEGEIKKGTNDLAEKEKTPKNKNNKKGKKEVEESEEVEKEETEEESEE